MTHASGAGELLSRRAALVSLGAVLIGGGTARAEQRPAYEVSINIPDPPPGPAEPLWLPGYSMAELDAAQARYGLTFPPDLVALLLERRPSQGYDWRTDDAAIRQMLAWPLEGLLFDVEESGLWWPEWGERPSATSERAEVLRSVVAGAPPLIPILSHRYLPAEPNEAGNPVFSIYQSDVIYYGADLADYFEEEFNPSDRPLPRRPRYIRFWSDLVERRAQMQYYPYREPFPRERNDG